MLLKGAWAVTTCNAALTDQIQALNQCRFLNSGTLSIRRRNAVVYCRSSSSNYCNNVNAPVLAVSAGEPRLKQKQTDVEKSLAERLRLGSLADDGLSYKEKFVVRCYEVGINKTATVETIANLLQVSPLLSLCLYELAFVHFLMFFKKKIKVAILSA